MTTATISKKKTRRPRRILFILLPILLILVLGFSILFFLSHQNLLFQFRNNLAATFHQRSLPQTVSVSSYTVQLDDLLSDPNCTKNQALMLINDEYPLSDSFQPEISYYKDTDVQMNSCIQDAYAAMSAAVRKLFDVPLYVREAYRTAKEQEEKTEENSAVAAEVGASEHQAGLALDLYVHSSADGLLQNRQPDVLLIPTAGIMVLSSAIRPTEKSKLASLTNRGICAMSAFPIPRSSWTNI